MNSFQDRTDIAAPIERVWAILADVERWPTWTASITRIEPHSPAPLGVGACLSIEQPKLWPADWTITQWQPPRRFTWQSRQLGVVATADHELAERDGGCSLLLRVSFRGWLASVVALAAGRLTQRYMKLEAAGLKKAAEAAR